MPSRGAPSSSPPPHEYTFSKMHGLGNDFVVIPLPPMRCRRRSAEADDDGDADATVDEGLSKPNPHHSASYHPLLLPLMADNGRRIRAMSNRRRGIGCDQFIVYCGVESEESIIGGSSSSSCTPSPPSVLLWIFNGSTGSEVGMCGNAVRCVVRHYVMSYRHTYYHSSGGDVASGDGYLKIRSSPSAAPSSSSPPSIDATFSVNVIVPKAQRTLQCAININDVPIIVAATHTTIDTASVLDGGGEGNAPSHFLQEALLLQHMRSANSASALAVAAEAVGGDEDEDASSAVVGGSSSPTVDVHMGLIRRGMLHVLRRRGDGRRKGAFAGGGDAVPTTDVLLACLRGDVVDEKDGRILAAPFSPHLAARLGGVDHRAAAADVFVALVLDRVSALASFLEEGRGGANATTPPYLNRGAIFGRLLPAIGLQSSSAADAALAVRRVAEGLAMSLESPFDGDGRRPHHPSHHGWSLAGVSICDVGNPHCVLCFEQRISADHANNTEEAGEEEGIGNKHHRPSSPFWMKDAFVSIVGFVVECCMPEVFPQGTNVEFAASLMGSPSDSSSPPSSSSSLGCYCSPSIRMRVWERGEGITEACGSGACAVGVAGHMLLRPLSPLSAPLPESPSSLGEATAKSYSVVLDGGILVIGVVDGDEEDSPSSTDVTGGRERISDIIMSGDATLVASGTMHL